MKKVRVRTENLQVGMITAETVMSFKGVTVVTQGYILDKSTIEKIKRHFVTVVTVQAEEEQEERKAKIVTKSEEIKMSEEFEIFIKNFDATKNELKNSFSDIINSDAEINVAHILDNMNNLINSSYTSYEIVEMLNCLKEDSDETFKHCMGVSLISGMMCRWLRFSEKETNDVVVAAILHDIGKLKIPKEILSKQTALLPKEILTIKKHAIYGYNILKSKVDEKIALVALNHHERYDGSGYPMKKRGLNIDSYSRIIAIADVFDSLTSKRVYRNAMCPFDVISMFEKDGITKFDAEYLLNFLSGLSETYIGNTVQLSDGRVGQIVFSNKSRPSRPMIKSGNRYIDLGKETQIRILKML